MAYRVRRAGTSLARGLAWGLLVSVPGVVTIVAMNLAGTAALGSLLAGGLTPDGLPVTVTARLLLAGVNVAAGVAGTVAVLLLLPEAHLRVGILVFLVLVLAFDTLAALLWWGRVPLWLSVSMVVLAPVQVGLGLLVAGPLWSRVRRQTRVA